MSVPPGGAAARVLALLDEAAVPLGPAPAAEMVPVADRPGRFWSPARGSRAEGSRVRGWLEVAPVAGPGGRAVWVSVPGASRWIPGPVCVPALAEGPSES